MLGRVQKKFAKIERKLFACAQAVIRSPARSHCGKRTNVDLIEGNRNLSVNAWVLARADRAVLLEWLVGNGGDKLELISKRRSGEYGQRFRLDEASTCLPALKTACNLAENTQRSALAA